MLRAIGSRLASRRCVSLRGIALLGAVTALSVPVGAKGIPRIQDLETEKKKGWVLGLVVTGGDSQVLSIRAVSPSARGKRHDLAVRPVRLSAATRRRLEAAGYTRSGADARMISPSEWEMYFSGGYAGVLFDALPPGEYSLGEYRMTGASGGGTTRILKTPLGGAADTFTVRPGEVVYLGSFGLYASSLSFPGLVASADGIFTLPATATRLESDITVRRKDDLPTALAVLEEVESGLGAAVTPRVVEAPRLKEAKAQAIQRVTALADRQEDLKRRHEQGLLTNVEFLEELLALARDVAATRRTRSKNPEEATLTPLLEKVKNPHTPIVVEKVVADIDKFVFAARMWRDSLHLFIDVELAPKKWTPC